MHSSWNLQGKATMALKCDRNDNKLSITALFVPVHGKTWTIATECGKIFSREPKFPRMPSQSALSIDNTFTLGCRCKRKYLT